MSTLFLPLSETRQGSNPQRREIKVILLTGKITKIKLYFNFRNQRKQRVKDFWWWGGVGVYRQEHLSCGLDRMRDLSREKMNKIGFSPKLS